MASTYTSNLRLEKQGSQENTGTWGALANGVFDRIDKAIAGCLTITFADATYTLTSNNGSDDEARNMMIICSGTNTAARALALPAYAKTYIIYNNTTGGFPVTVTRGGTSVSLANGDWSWFWTDGTTVRRLPSEDEAAEVTVASGATCNILGAASERVAISGTTTITSLGTGPNRVRFVRFTGALTLTHNSTSLILPGAANITTVAGDTMIVVSDASSNARIISYQRGSPPIGKLIDIQTFTASGTWTKPTGTLAVEVWVTGGGGGGGGAAVTSSTTVATSAGGGGGGTAYKYITSSIGATETVTVGAGGAGGSGASAATGSTGGTSSFGSHCSATGGSGGAGCTAALATNQVGGAGGVGSSGTVNFSGDAGSAACGLASADLVLPGTGGASMFGGGGVGTHDATGGLGGYYGGGGGGSGVGTDSAARTGGAGNGGIVTVKSYG